MNICLKGTIMLSRATAPGTILLLLGLFSTAAQAAEVVKLTNGGTLTGRVLEEQSTADTLVIDLFSGNVMHIPRTTVLEITTSAAYVEHITEAEVLKESQRWIDAARKFHEAKESTEDENVRQRCSGEIDQIARTLYRELQNGNPNHLPLEDCLEVIRLSSRTTSGQQLITRAERVIAGIRQSEAAEALSRVQTQFL